MPLLSGVVFYLQLKAFLIDMQISTKAQCWTASYGAKEPKFQSPEFLGFDLSSATNKLYDLDKSLSFSVTHRPYLYNAH